LRLPLTSAMFSRTRSPVVKAESTGGRDETGACPGRRDRRDQRAREAIATASGRSPVMKLEAVAGPGSVARVSQESGVEDARSVRQRDILKTLQQTRQVDVRALAQRVGVSGTNPPPRRAGSAFPASPPAAPSPSSTRRNSYSGSTAGRSSAVPPPTAPVPRP